MASRGFYVTTKPKKQGRPKGSAQYKDVPTMVHLSGRETLQDLHAIRELLEEETGMDVTYPNVIKYLIKYYLKER